MSRGMHLQDEQLYGRVHIAPCPQPLSFLIFGLFLLEEVSYRLQYVNVWSSTHEFCVVNPSSKG